MPFDISTAKDVGEKSGGGFDIKTAKDATPEKSDNLFTKFYSNLSAKETKPLSPIMAGDIANNPMMNIPRLLASGLGIGEENVFPMAGQLIGGRFGLPGAVAGATIGQGIRQLAQPIRGKKIEPMALGKEALTTGVIEGITRGAGKVLFRQQRAIREVTEGAGKRLKQAYDTLSNASDTNPALSIDSNKILDVVKPAFDKIKVPFGKQSTILKRWMKVLETNPRLSARNLIELEQDLGEVANFAKTSGGEAVMQEIPKKALNKLVKEARNLVSNQVDDLAEQAGIQGFKELNKTVSKNLGIAFGKKASLLRTAVTSGALGGLVGTATMNPTLGFGVSGIGIGLTNPALRNALFRGVERTGLGRAATLGLSEAVRRDLGKAQ